VVVGFRDVVVSSKDDVLLLEALLEDDCVDFVVIIEVLNVDVVEDDTLLLEELLEVGRVDCVVTVEVLDVDLVEDSTIELDELSFVNNVEDIEELLGEADVTALLVLVVVSSFKRAWRAERYRSLLLSIGSTMALTPKTELEDELEELDELGVLEVCEDVFMVDDLLSWSASSSTAAAAAAAAY